MKKILAFILSLSLLAALTACGGNAPASTGSSAAASDPASAAAPETSQEVPAEAPGSDQTAETSSAEPASAPEAEVVPANTIEYPLSESYTFTMTATLRNNVLQVLGDDDFSVTSAYRGLAEATGCSIDFNMLGEATAEEKPTLCWPPAI